MVGERDTGEEERDTGEKEREREKITNTKKFMEFYLVVLQSTVALQSCYRF